MRQTKAAALIVVVVWTSALSCNCTTASNKGESRSHSYVQVRKDVHPRSPDFKADAHLRPSSVRARPSTRVRQLLLTGRRDPFRLPPPPSHSAGAKNDLPAHLPPGPRGLLIDQLTLKGVVWDNSGQTEVAIVTNKSQVAYFLRENEQVYDGVVTRITPDAIYFRKRVLTSSGALGFRVVVKELSGLQGE
jgi:hypothetical protein